MIIFLVSYNDELGNLMVENVQSSYISHHIH